MGVSLKGKEGRGKGGREKLRGREAFFVREAPMKGKTNFRRQIPW